MKSKPLIYIADLTYSTTVLSSDTFPIGIGYVTAYAKKKVPDLFTFNLFKVADTLFDAIDRELPDILAMSYFPWNKNLSLMVAQYYKQRKPEGTVVIGGTFVPGRPEVQTEFFKKYPFVELLVKYDGEFGFLEFLKRYLSEDGYNKQIFCGEQLDGCDFWSKDEGVLKIGKIVDRPKNLDDIPSPYLTGILDHFFENQLMSPMIQSTRGCPFLCTYCWAGNAFNSTVKHFSIERILSEIDYITEKRKDSENRLLVFADANFGMYVKDELIADKIALLQRTHNYPSSFNSPCGKNNKERVLRMLKKIKNAFPIVSIQSTDYQIQQNVKRKPIDIEEYKDIVTSIKQLGIRVQTDIITGLPGETRETHLQTIKDLIYMGFDEVSAFTLMFLEGTELNTKDSLEKNDWYRRYRVVPRNFGKFRGEVCFEIETVGVGSNTLTFDDYLFLRGFQGALAMIFNTILFSEFTNYLKNNGISLFDFALSFYEDLKGDPGPAGTQFRYFLNEVHGELWESEEEVKSYFMKEENYHKLLSGEIGDNLLHKYKIVSIDENFNSWCEYFYRQSLKQLEGKCQNRDILVTELADIKNHILAKSADIFSIQNANGEPYSIKLLHNVSQWKNDNYIHPLAQYRYEKLTEAKYVIREENKRLVTEILTLYSKDKSALWKVASARYYLPAIFRIAQASVN
jgi:radical SAM superfamily enzyme YgiQ (UPF0313 family)